MMLPPKPRQPDPVELLQRQLDTHHQPLRRLLPVHHPCTPDPCHLFSSLYCLLSRDAILPVLERTGTLSQRQRRLPAHEVVWLVIAQSWFPHRSLPMVWRHLHPSTDHPDPVDSAFTQARQRLGARPLQLLFQRTCRPLSVPGTLGAFHRHWLLVALDASVFEAPDTRSNRRVLGSAANQNGEGAFPQLRLAAICEVGTHAITDVQIGSYNDSEQKLSLRLLRRLPSNRLVLMDRGLSYFEVIAAVRRRKSQVLARVKAKQRDRALPVEEVLPDGSYLSTIYPSSNAKRARKKGLRVRVVRYTHDDEDRDGSGEVSRLLTTVLSPKLLLAQEMVRLYRWRWEEETVFAEIKGMLGYQQPLLRSKTPTLVLQEMYGLLLGHYLVRQVMAQAAQEKGREVEAVRLSFRRSLQVLEDRLKDEEGPKWHGSLVGEVRRQKLRAKRPCRHPRVKKATRSRWPNKPPGSKPPRQPKKHLSEITRILQTDES
jgi:Insertion element 4 transposase N-terminal/Transposase DDE domain